MKITKSRPAWAMIEREKQIIEATEKGRDEGKGRERQGEREP